MAWYTSVILSILSCGYVVCWQEFGTKMKRELEATSIYKTPSTVLNDILRLLPTDLHILLQSTQATDLRKAISQWQEVFRISFTISVGSKHGFSSLQIRFYWELYAFA